MCPETVRLRHRARLRPQRVSVPSEIRAVFVRASTVGFCAFAVSGLYGAVAPTMLTSLLHLQSHLLAGGLRSINARAPEVRRGEAASAFFVVIYVGLAVPVIGFGLAASEFGLRATGIAFGAIVAVVLVAVMASLPRGGASLARETG
jgi:hypothetical protein